MTILIADSGSTKTDWLLYDTTTLTTLPFQSSGLNPCLMDDEQIVCKLREEVRPQIPATVHIDALYFYGAGCRPDQTERMSEHLARELSADVKIVASDLLGAARALCGEASGIVAILGTGSGSALFDGTCFTAQTPSLGYILGDEGSGAVLGRRLVADVLKRQMPEHIIRDFESSYDVSTEEVIRRVYREVSPNRYLASFVPFLEAHIHEEAISQLVVNEFRQFFIRNVLPYERLELPVNFVGSIAHLYATQLRQAAESCDCKVGKILRTPGEEILAYHINKIGVQN